ncbi:MAG: hypothetical protein ACOYKZ_00900 [Chlamydiia bacterium]
MTRNLQRIPAFLTQTWMAAACIGLIGSASGQAFEFREVAIGTGYRQDASSLSICSTLSDPDFFGYGKMRARNVRIWEIGIGAAASITDHAYARASIAYGFVLGGKVVDSGIADISSDPFNAVIGEYYGTCCSVCPPCTDPGPCSCDCDGAVYRHTVPVTATVKGNTFDFDLAFGFEFRACSDMIIAPVIGYQFNQQRQRWDQSIWGPISLAVNPLSNSGGNLGNIGSLCGYDVPYDLDSEGLITQDDGIYYGDLDALNNPEVLGYALIGNARLNSTIGTGETAVTTENGLLGPQCVGFGDCFNGTVYRARWNGPYIGIDLGWEFTSNWRAAASYALHFSHYNGEFTTFGGNQGSQCDCNFCPQWLEICGAPANDLTLTPIGFAPSQMAFATWGIGQEVNLATDYRCGQWAIGFALGYQYRQVSHCIPSDPCGSCVEVCNGSLGGHYVNPNAAVLSVVPDNGTSPIWQFANMQRARWSSFSALVTLEFMF